LDNEPLYLYDDNRFSGDVIWQDKNWSLLEAF